MGKWLKKAAAAALCLGIPTLSVHGGEMRNHTLNLPLFEKTAVEFSAKDLEHYLELEEGDLTALTFLTIPERGTLYSCGVAVEKGETLLRWELEQLCYLSDKDESDWFAVLPVCSEELCAVVNLKAMG